MATCEVCGRKKGHDRIGENYLCAFGVAGYLGGEEKCKAIGYERQRQRADEAVAALNEALARLKESK